MGLCRHRRTGNEGGAAGGKVHYCGACVAGTPFSHRTGHAGGKTAGAASLGGRGAGTLYRGG